MDRISICDVGPPFSVTVTGAVHASCGAAQIRSCLQHSTQCMPYKSMHNAFNSTADRLYKRDCLLQPTWLAISISSTFTGTAQQRTRSASTSEHSTMSAVILIISYRAYFLKSLIIQLHIECFINSEFFINSSLIFSCLISPPIFTIHR